MPVIYIHHLPVLICCNRPESYIQAILIFSREYIDQNFVSLASDIGCYGRRVCFGQATKHFCPFLQEPCEWNRLYVSYQEMKFSFLITICNDDFNYIWVKY